MHPSTTRAQVYKVDDPCYDIGGGVPPIGIKVEDPICGISRAIQGVSFQYLEVSIKNARFKPQASASMLAFALMRSTPFIKIDDKGGEIVQRYESSRRDWIWTWTKRALRN
jgi:hypothetical protein